ncbi:MAG: hypothetical protein M9921_15080 [Fimbriimonadaceae bacterium]|nr:hypothetical protein [Fimbriimonadaceae bacterium]
MDHVVTVATNRRSKKIEDHGGSGPDELWAVQTMIDGLVQTATDWEKVKG